MTIREAILRNILRINKDINYPSGYFDIMNDLQLLQYHNDCLYMKAYNEGYDDCCKDNPDNDNVTYLT